MQTRLVTDTILWPNGSPAVNEPVTFKLTNGSFTDDASVLRRELTTHTDLEGKYQIPLFCTTTGGTVAVWVATYPDGEQIRFSLAPSETSQVYILRTERATQPALRTSSAVLFELLDTRYFQIDADTGGVVGPKGDDGKSAYDLWLAQGNSGTVSDFLASLHGAAGATGAAGKSAYELWLAAGNSGSTATFLASLIGPSGQDGIDGKSAYDLWIEQGNSGTLTDFLNSLKGADGVIGADGKSAYQLWVEDGNAGTVTDFLTALKGADGEPGAIGATGKSAYQIWLDQGNTGTEADFIASLKGDKGDKGDPGANQDGSGKSAYQIAVDNGFVGTEAEWLDSLHGADGADGKSAYDLWLAAGNTGTEADFFNSLRGADGVDGQDGTSAYDLWLTAGNTGDLETFLTSLQGEPGRDGAPGEKGDPGPATTGIHSVAGVPDPALGVEGEYAIDWIAVRLYGPKTSGNWGDGIDLVGESGTDGKSAYQVWLDAGNTGTELDMLASFNGTDGKSAYQLWLDLGNEGTESDFLATLKGNDGRTILSPSGPPSASDGQEGDYAIDWIAARIYGPKTSGDWGAGKSLVGPKGDDGIGLPTGGIVNQFLKKNSATDYDYGWASLSAADITSGQFDADLLPPSGVAAGSYGTTAAIPHITVDDTGRITAVEEVAITGGGSSTAAIIENFYWTLNGSMIYTAPEAGTYTVLFERGVGTMAYQKATAAAPDTFTTATGPFVLEAGGQLKLTVSGISGYKSVVLKKTS